MIRIYTVKKDDYVISNNNFFFFNTVNKQFSKEDLFAMEKIDHAILTKDYHIQTPFGVGMLIDLSTGCKTYLNVTSYPDKIFCVDECGPNVLEMLFQLDDVRIYSSYMSSFPIDDNKEILFNDNDLVAGRWGYLEWWEKEYDRRDNDDL